MVCSLCSSCTYRALNKSHDDLEVVEVLVAAIVIAVVVPVVIEGTTVAVVAVQQN